MAMVGHAAVLPLDPHRRWFLSRFAPFSQPHQIAKVCPPVLGSSPACAPCERRVNTQQEAQPRRRNTQ